jgi:hypothetical protein
MFTLEPTESLDVRGRRIPSQRNVNRVRVSQSPAPVLRHVALSKSWASLLRHVPPSSSEIHCTFHIRNEAILESRAVGSGLRILDKNG